MPYFRPTEHQCTNCRGKYLWDCVLPHFPGEVAMVRKTADCVHGKLLKKIDVNTIEFPAEIEVKIKCPYCGTEDIELVTVDLTYP